MITLWLRDQLAGQRLEHETQQYLQRLRQAPVLRSQNAATLLLRQLRRQAPPHVRLGDTTWGEPVIVPLTELVKACGLITGGMGSGKTMFALLPIRTIIQRLPSLSTVSCGAIDPKGELFDRMLYLLAARIQELQGRERQELLERLVIIDFSNRNAISSYNILNCPPDADADFFISSRLETLRELLPASERPSVPATTVLRNAIALLVDAGRPAPDISRLLSDPDFRQQLVARSRNPEVRSYFHRHFAEVPKQTIGALRSRFDALFASDSVRLALAGSTAPDFRRLQNEGKIVLINCSGPTITRGARLLLQSLVLSDIRQAIFARPNNPPVTYVWICDEAQNFFLSRQQQEDMTDVLTMARSFGSFFWFLCQNLTTSIADARIVEQLHTNIRWSLTLRGTPRDAQFLRPALPVTGRAQRPEPRPFRESTVYSLEEERALLLDGIAHLPDRAAYLWLKARSGEAIKLRTESLGFPQGEEFRQVAAELRDDPALGARVSRAEYARQIAERDRTWLGAPEQSEPIGDRWEKAYRQQEALWRT